MKDKNLTVPEKEAKTNQLPADASKIMYDALVRIAHSDAFFSGEKRLVSIARKAIEQVTNVR